MNSAPAQRELQALIWLAPRRSATPVVAAGALRRLRIPNRIGLIAPAMRDNGRMRNGRGAR